jgi:acetyl esterase/lipase
MKTSFRNLAVLATLFASLAVLAKDIEVVAVYYPHWHRYPKGDEWFGKEKWKEGEWTFVKTARPKFPGHNQPLVPVAGYLKGDSPEDMEKEIALAANAGIDVFLYDYYYYGGKITQEESLENGFLKAKNKDRLKFALMWCYHERRDQFRPAKDAPRRMLMELDHTPEEFLGLIDHSIKKYFHLPEYWKKDGKLFFSIYNAPYFIKHLGNEGVKAALQEARRRVRDAGLGELHLNAQNVKPADFANAADLGFDSITDYNVGPFDVKNFISRYIKGVRELDYGEIIEANVKRWNDCSKGPVPYIPSVTTGWDRTPRCRQSDAYPWPGAGPKYPYEATVTNNTPDRFKTYLRLAKEHAEKDPLKPGAVYINGWNEYTEGAWLVPDNFNEDGYLRAIAEVFGRNPANEYVFADASTKKLFSCPVQTFADVAYDNKDYKQKVDVWLPGNATAKTPAIVYFHGGGWTAGVRTDRIIASSVKKIVDAGIAVVAVGYRYIRDAKGVKPPVAVPLEDAEKAMEFIIANAGKWNIDTSRIALSGGSAGAVSAMWLALKDGNKHKIAALAPIIPQTSLDPKEMREWVANVKYGAHAFGYKSFDDWLAHREECLADIERISPSALARKIDAEKAPRIFILCFKPAPAGTLPKDPTHAGEFGLEFKKICDAKNIHCEITHECGLYFSPAFENLIRFFKKR